MSQFSLELIDRLKSAKKVAVLTGAGVSAESGVPTFRDPGGLWSKFKPEELANFEAFWNNTELVWSWYQHRRDLINKVEPNDGHHALVSMAQKIENFSLITQNVDSLHQRAGSEDVIELHGNIMRSYCIDCGKDAKDVEVNKENPIPLCEYCGGKVRPGVVWFGEMLPEEALRSADQKAREAEVFFSIGTSALVYPAAQLPLIAKEAGAYVVEINPQPTALTQYVDEALMAPSGEVLPQILSKI